MIRIPKTIYNQLLAHAKAEAPAECCGLLAGREDRVGQHYRIANIIAREGAELINFDAAKAAHLQSLSPESRAAVAFVMDAREMSLAFKDMRARELTFMAIYHSHPRGPDHPSHTDVKIAVDFTATREALHLPEPFHIIIDLTRPEHPAVKAYRITDGQILPEKLDLLAL